MPELAKLALVGITACRHRAELAVRHRQRPGVGDLGGAARRPLESLDRRLEVHANDERCARARLVPTLDRSRSGHGSRIGVAPSLTLRTPFESRRGRPAAKDASVSPTARADEK